jgi:tRNA(Ile)-lysidine synthase
VTRPAATPAASAACAQALDALDAAYFSTPHPTLAVALSGGLDSCALLHMVVAHARARGWTVLAFHVHHGLSPNADAWRAHCAGLAAGLGLLFDAREVRVVRGKSGIEAAARKARYAALGAMCRAHGANVLLTAHHLDDQAETVLLQLLRGSGPAGLAGMDGVNRAPALLGDDTLLIARPLLGVPRTALEAYAHEHALAWVEDESNADPRYTRNTLRHAVMPALAAAFPGCQERIARAGRHARATRRLLEELAAQDLEACLDREHDALLMALLRPLSPERLDNLLRYWMATRGLAMPSTAWLAQMVGQLFSARDDAQLLVQHPACHVRRHRDRLYMVPKPPDLAGLRDPDDIGVLEHFACTFRWSGEASLAFPDYGGVLHFDPAAHGFDPAWLRARPLDIDFRKGGERLKLAPNRPTRGLKAHYQACDIPAWERTHLPVVMRDGVLLFAAGLGMDCRHMTDGSDRIALRWETTIAA